MKKLLLLPIFFISFLAQSQIQDSGSVQLPQTLVHPYHKNAFSVGCGLIIGGLINEDGSKGYYRLGAEPRLSYFFADFTSVNFTYFQTKLQTFGIDTAEVHRRATGSIFVRRYLGQKRIFFADLAFTAGQLYAHTDYQDPIETTAYKVGYGIGASWVLRKHLGPLNNRLAFEIYYRKLISLKRKDYRGPVMLPADANLLALHFYFARPSVKPSAE